MSQSPDIKRTVVLGAGVMGAQIAALLANAGLKVDLLDMPGEDGEVGLAQEGIERALKSRPPAFFLPEMAQRITAGSIADLSCVAEADWVIEVIVEDMEAKKALLARVDEVAGPELIVSSNTSGLSIGEMGRERSERFRRRFLGTHFFNPPRYMKLVELVPGPDTDPALAAQVGQFLEGVLGKGVVETRDTPNFIANRLGVFTLMEALQRMEREGLAVEEVDALTGPLMGRPRSAILRLCDLIGLDTLVHVARTAYEQLPEDSQREVFAAPAFVQRMLQQGLLGVKARKGFYCKTETGIQALDLEKMEYRETEKVDLGTLGKAVRHPDLRVRLQAVWDDESRPHGWSHLRQVLLYAAEHAAEMAADITQIDQAMKWGFNWEAGPFEIWDLLGVEQVAARCEREGVEAPVLVGEVLAAGESRFYAKGEDPVRVFSMQEGKPVALPTRSGEPYSARLNRGRALFHNDSAYLVEVEEDVGALVFEGKMNVLGPQALELVQRTVQEQPFAAVVLCGAGNLFSAGADLQYIAALIEEGDWEGLEAYVRNFQDAILALRYAPFPVVAAPRGLTLGGGCEFCMAADARVVAAELQIGLVETQVGLIPAGGGCKEMVRRRGRDIEPGFRTLFAGRFSDNAHQGRQWQLLDPEDDIAMNEDRLLPRALERARSLVEAGYVSPSRIGLPVAGDEGLHRLELWLDEQVQAGPTSTHDRVVGNALARVLCGGDGPPRQVDEQELLDLEREVFLGLSGLELTQQRVAHMLRTGKPLRN